MASRQLELRLWERNLLDDNDWRMRGNCMRGYCSLTSKLVERLLVFFKDFIKIVIRVQLEKGQVCSNSYCVLVRRKYTSK
jgi:hypothetical protein